MASAMGMNRGKRHGSCRPLVWMVVASPVLVTVAFNRVEFKNPVLVGDILRCLVSLVKIGRTSITVKVIVEVERGAATIHVTEAEVVNVRIDPTSPERKPIPLLK